MGKNTAQKIDFGKDKQGVVTLQPNNNLDDDLEEITESQQFAQSSNQMTYSMDDGGTDANGNAPHQTSLGKKKKKKKKKRADEDGETDLGM